MVSPQENPEPPTGREQFWAWVRLALGTGQIIGPVTACMMLVQAGITAAALVAVCPTCLCTTVSVMLFGSRRSQ